MPRPSIITEPAMFDPDKLIEISIQQTIEKDIEKNIIRFTSSYPNFDFTGYFPTFPDYFIDCCGAPFCPDGCEENSSDCPKKKKTPDNLRLKRQHWSEIRSCPKKQQLVYMRAHIGDLTKQEIECIRQVSYARTYIVFRLATEITPDSPEHSMLLKNFEAVKTANRQGLSREDRFRVLVALAVIKLAAHLRSTRRRAWGYSLIVGNVPGIPVDQSARAAFTFLPNSASPTTKAKDKSKKKRKPRISKYDVAVERYLRELAEAIEQGDQKAEFAEKLSPMDIAKALHEKDIFKTKKIKGIETETTITSIKDRVRRSEPWKNRKKILQPIYGEQPPDVADVLESWTDEGTGELEGLNKVEVREEFEALVEEYLQALRNAFLHKKITPEDYWSKAARLTPADIAEWIKQTKPKFKKRGTESIKYGVANSSAWLNRDETLDMEACPEWYR